MADIITQSFLNSASGATQMSNTDQLVAAYKQANSSKVTGLETKKKDLETRRTFYNNLLTRLNTLTSSIDTYSASDIGDKFGAKSVTTSDSSYVTATANEGAVLGINQVKILRLASNDVLVSDAMELAGEFQNTGSQTFSLTVNGTEKTINVDIAGGATNEQALKAIVNAINDTEDIEVNASYVKTTTTEGRITLTSKTSGSSNAISFSENGNKVLNELGLTNKLANDRDVFTDDKAGYAKSNSSELNSKFLLNGLTIYRESNTVDDALPEVTLNLLRPQADSDQAITLTTAVDTSSVSSFIKPLLDNFNSLLSFLTQNKSLQRSDGSLTSLYSRVRAVSSQLISPLNSDDPRSITDIGITIARDGTLSITDSTKLADLLKDDPGKVLRLFTASDGFVARVNDAISSLSGSGGLILSKTQNLGLQIDYYSNKIDTTQKSIDKQAESLRKEYESMLKVYLKAQNQYQSLLSQTTG